MSSPRSSIESLSSRGEGEPNTLGEHSSSTLILIRESQETERESIVALQDESNDLETALQEGERASRPQLSSFVCFLYMVSPNLKLGAVLFAACSEEKKWSVASLVVFFLLSIFAKSIWYLLARYVRGSTLEDIIVEAVTRDKHKDRLRAATKFFTKLFRGVLLLSLATIYLRVSVDQLLLHVSGINTFISTRVLMTLAAFIIVLPLCSAPSIISKRVRYSTLLSLCLYIIWLSILGHAANTGILDSDFLVLNLPGKLWQCIPVVAFAFTSTHTLQLYSMMMEAAPIVLKDSRFRNLNTLSAAAELVAAAVLLPLVFYQHSVKTTNTVVTTENVPALKAVASIAMSLNLIFAIPPLIISIPTLPLRNIHMRVREKFSSKFLMTLIATFLAMGSSAFIAVISDLTIFMAFTGTYVLPAVLHIVHHFIRRPLTILLHPTTPGPSEPQYAHEPSTDELLRRKERAMQRRRMGRRCFWDTSVWVVLIPVGIVGYGYAIGRLAGQW